MTTLFSDVINGKTYVITQESTGAPIIITVNNVQQASLSVSETISKIKLEPLSNHSISKLLLSYRSTDAKISSIILKSENNKLSECGNRKTYGSDVKDISVCSTDRICTTSANKLIVYSVKSAGTMTQVSQQQISGGFATNTGDITSSRTSSGKSVVFTMNNSGTQFKVGSASGTSKITLSNFSPSGVTGAAKAIKLVSCASKNKTAGIIVTDNKVYYAKANTSSHLSNRDVKEIGTVSGTVKEIKTSVTTSGKDEKIEVSLNLSDGKKHTIIIPIKKSDCSISGAITNKIEESKSQKQQKITTKAETALPPAPVRTETQKGISTDSPQNKITHTSTTANPTENPQTTSTISFSTAATTTERKTTAIPSTNVAMHLSQRADTTLGNSRTTITQGSDNASASTKRVKKHTTTSRLIPSTNVATHLSQRADTTLGNNNTSITQSSANISTSSVIAGISGGVLLLVFSLFICLVMVVLKRRRTAERARTRRHQTFSLLERDNIVREDSTDNTSENEEFIVKRENHNIESEQDESSEGEFENLELNVRGIMDAAKSNATSTSLSEADVIIINEHEGKHLS